METKFTMGVPTLPLTGFKLSPPSPSSSPLLPGGVSGLDLLSVCALPAFPPAAPQQFHGSLPPLSSFMGPVSLLPPQHLAVPFQLTPEGQRDLLALLTPPPATPASIILQNAAALTRKHHQHIHHHSEGTCTEEETDSNSHSDDEEDSEEGEGDEVDSEEGEAARAGDSHLLEIPNSKDRGSSSTSSPVLVAHHHAAVDSVKLPGRRGRRPKPPHERRHKCTMCNRDFKRMEHLKRHLRVHTGEKPFSCPFPGCPKYFSRQDNLTQHIKTHKNRAERGSLGHLSEDGGDDQE